MAETKKCPYCSEEILADAKKCKHCGEYLDDTLKAKAQQETKVVAKEGCFLQTLNVGCIAIIIIVGVLILALFLINTFSSKSNESTTIESTESLNIKPPEKLIPYEIIREWKIPNGGFGRVIVVSPQYRNKQDLQALGLNLRYDTRNDRNSLIEVFDNKKAADLSRKVANLSKEEGALFDKHKIGQYFQNINTGYHRFNIWINGLTSEGITIDYSKEY